VSGGGVAPHPFASLLRADDGCRQAKGAAEAGSGHTRPSSFSVASHPSGYSRHLAARLLLGGGGGCKGDICEVSVVTVVDRGL
jgi:hypothetical protein